MRPLLLLFLVLLAVPVKAADSVLAPSGTLRAAYIGPNVAQARLDSATGTVSGVIADIARELGRRADVPVTITPLPTAATVIEAVRSGAADIGFVAPNPERTGAHRARALFADLHARAADAAGSRIIRRVING